MKSRFLVLALMAQMAVANDTAMHEGASGPEPVGWTSGRESIIQMKEEEITVKFSKGRSKVHVKFVFVSHKKGGDACQTLGFPDLSRAEHEGDLIGPLEKLVTKVNGKAVPSKLVEGYYAFEEKNGIVTRKQVKKGEGQKFAWHTISVVFPPGKEVVVERVYETPNGMTAGGPEFFTYETRTGGNWRGKIESLKASVEIDEGVDLKQITLQPKGEWVWKNKQVAELRWKNFEPRTNEKRQWFSVDRALSKAELGL